MDVQFFLKERTKFIRGYYRTASAPFFEVKRAIEAGDPPFNNPPFDDSGEPAFLEEWLEADQAIEVVGRSCLSMLSASLKLYFQAWEQDLCLELDEKDRKKAFKLGILSGYREIFEGLLGVPWAGSPADLDLIEQVVLARNRDQHPESLFTMSVSHSDADRRAHGSLFFVRDSERGLLVDDDSSFRWLNPAIYVSPESMDKALDEVEKLASWLDEEIFAWRYGRRAHDSEPRDTHES